MLFPRLAFPNNVCMSTESVGVHSHRSHTFSGTVHYGKDAWIKADNLWPSCAFDLQQESWSLYYHVPFWGLFDSIPWVFTAGFNQREVMVMLPSTMKYISFDMLLSLCKQRQEHQHICLPFYKRPPNTQNLWGYQEDMSTKILFPIITLPKLVLIHLWLPWVPWPLAHLIMMGRIWTPGPANTSWDGYRCWDPLSAWLGSHWWLVGASHSSRGTKLRSTLGTKFGLSTRTLRILAICLITIFTWGKLILSYFGEWIPW